MTQAGLECQRELWRRERARDARVTATGRRPRDTCSRSRRHGNSTSMSSFPLAGWCCLALAASGACRPAARSLQADPRGPEVDSRPAITPRQESPSSERSPTTDTGPAECQLETPELPVETATFDWQTPVVRGPAGWLTSAWADARGIWVAGGDSPAKHSSRPFIAQLSPRGRESWRVVVDQGFRPAAKAGRAAALATSATAAGDVYTVIFSAHSPGTLFLSKLDGAGRHRWTNPVELANAGVVLTTDARGNAVLVGAVAPRGGVRDAATTLRIEKYSTDGVRLWSRSYDHDGELPRIVRKADDHLVLAASLHGAAQFGDTRHEHRGQLGIRCAGEDEGCPVDQPSTGLLLAELDHEGAPLWSRLFAAPGSLIAVSDLAVSPDGHLFVTGEYQGPKMNIESLALCELRPGMPAAERRPAFEPGPSTDPCVCLRDERDLFVLALDEIGEPRWAKTLALGRPQPRLASTPRGNLVWAAQLFEGAPDAATQPGAVAQPSAADRRLSLSLWNIDPSGAVLRRRAAPGVGLEFVAAAPDGSLYLSDGKSLRKTSIE